LSATFPVYVVDDEPQIRALLVDLCEHLGWRAQDFATGLAFLEAAETLAPGCVLLDMRMPGWNGMKVQAELARSGAPFAVIAITGHGDVDMAVESMKLGAVDFIEKPFDTDVLIDAIRRAFDKLQGA
jgi:two-component system, LuxR family, response regulator FixJ